MLAKKLKYGAFLVAVALLSSCSKKDLPQGTRLAVLPIEKAEGKEVMAGENKISLPTAQKNSAWTQSGGNSEHSYGNLHGHYPLKKLWQKKFGASAGRRDLLISEPVVAENMLFTLDAKAEVSAFNLEDGTLLWTAKTLDNKGKKTASSFKGAGLAANASNVFVTTGLGEVVALDLKTGSSVWKHDASTPLRTAPAVASGKVYVQTIDNRLIAINARTGEEVWNYEILQEDTTFLGGASPAISSGQDLMVAAFSNGELQAFKASTGSILWNNMLVANRYSSTLSSINAVRADPVIVDDVVYAVGNSKTLAAIDSLSGERLWAKPLSGAYQPIVSGKYLFVLSSDNFLSAMEKENGTLVWSRKLPLEDVALRPLLMEGYLLIATIEGKVFKVDAKTGEVIETFDIGKRLSVSPISVDGKLIFSTTSAEILVYE